MSRGRHRHLPSRGFRRRFANSQFRAELPWFGLAAGIVLFLTIIALLTEGA